MFYSCIRGIKNYIYNFFGISKIQRIHSNQLSIRNMKNCKNTNRILGVHGRREQKCERSTKS